MSQARQIAFDILNRVHRGRRPLDHWLDAAEPRMHALARADRAMVHALVYGALRWQARLDYIIDHLSRHPGRIDPEVRTILRLALFQIHHLDRIPARAVVHSAVELAKNNGRAWAAGFVNGVLRRAAAAPHDIDWPDWETAPEQALAAQLAMPHWLAARWIRRWGLEEARRLCEAINAIPPVTIRANTLKTDRAALMAAIDREARRIEATRYAPEGIVVSSFERPLPQWAAFQDGWFQVQDEAAQLVAHFLSPLPGETVWDACAGLGTKTAHLAQLMRNKGTIVATDWHASKLNRLQSEMQRLGVSIVRHRPMDLAGEAPEADLPAFDRILVDAPCSGLGVLQKNPDGKWKVSRADLDRCRQRQIALLARAASHLRAGGTLVYAVCSVEPEENEAVVEAFLQKRRDFAIHVRRLAALTAPGTLLTREGHLRTLPHRHGMDGFFAAALVKKAESV